MNSRLTHNELDEPVTRFMRLDFVQFHEDWTVRQALDDLRQRTSIGRIIYFYVVDAEGRLRGVVPTRRLLLSDPQTPLREIMISPVIAIPDTATVLEACEFFTLHRLLAFPIVDAQRRLIGIVDVELYTREIGEIDLKESNDDLFQLIGVHLTEAQQRSPFQAARRRFPWLLANIAGGLLAAWITDLFRDVSSLPLVVPFIPIVLALAESVTIQSVSLTVQTLHGRRGSWRTLVPRMACESLTGLLLGIACGLIVGIVGLIWKGSEDAALSLLIGIGGAVACAAAIGLTMPLVLRLLRCDPQVAAGPLALATTDTVTLILYFSLARSVIAG
jgi:magnesium transporter